MKVVLKKDYRPMDVKGVEQPEYRAGDALDLPNDEATRALDLDIAETPGDAAKEPAELTAIALLTDLGYTVTPPKDAKKADPVAANAPDPGAAKPFVPVQA